MAGGVVVFFSASLLPEQSQPNGFLFLEFTTVQYELKYHTYRVPVVHGTKRIYNGTAYVHVQVVVDCNSSLHI
jgi:hypothetical protein